MPRTAVVTRTSAQQWYSMRSPDGDVLDVPYCDVLNKLNQGYDFTNSADETNWKVFGRSGD